MKSDGTAATAARPRRSCPRSSSARPLPIRARLSAVAAVRARRRRHGDRRVELGDRRVEQLRPRLRRAVLERAVGEHAARRHAVAVALGEHHVHERRERLRLRALRVLRIEIAEARRDEIRRRARLLRVLEGLQRRLVDVRRRAAIDLDARVVRLRVQHLVGEQRGHLREPLVVVEERASGRRSRRRRRAGSRRSPRRRRSAAPRGWRCPAAARRPASAP